MWQVGNTSSFFAAQNGQEAVVRLLLEHKASVNAATQVRSRSGQCGGLVRYVCMGHAGIDLGWWRGFERGNAGMTRGGSRKKRREHGSHPPVAVGLDPKSVASTALIPLSQLGWQLGWTPLHAAANCPAEKAGPLVMKLLLAAGAAVDARDGVRG